MHVLLSGSTSFSAVVSFEDAPKKRNKNNSAINGGKKHEKKNRTAAFQLCCELINGFGKVNFHYRFARKGFFAFQWPCFKIFTAYISRNVCECFVHCICTTQKKKSTHTNLDRTCVSKSVTNVLIHFLQSLLCIRLGQVCVCSFFLCSTPSVSFSCIMFRL